MHLFIYLAIPTCFPTQKLKSASYFQLRFQLLEESSNNHPKTFPHVPTACVISYIIPAPTLVTAAVMNKEFCYPALWQLMCKF